MRFLLFLLLLAATPISVVARDIKTVAELVTPALATAKNDFNRALLLRDQIHRAHDPTSGLPSATTAELSDAAAAYRMSVLEDTRSNACNGKAILFIAALREYGIDARIVQLYSAKEVGTMVWSHASVDVKIGDKWLAMDPTYNVSLVGASGVALSWSEAVERKRTGKFVLPHTDGKLVMPGRSFSDAVRRQGYRFEDLAKYVLLGPWRGGPAENLTPGWDGKIKYLTGETFDAWASISAQFYQALAAPVAAPGHARTSPVLQR